MGVEVVSRRTLRWTGILGPGVIAGLFETLRHDYLDHWMPLPHAYGNLATGLLVIVASALLLGQVFRLMDRAQEDLRIAEARNSVLYERERIARDLHDGISQSIFYLNVKVNEIEKTLGDRAAAVDEDFGEVRTVLAGLYDRVRKTIFELKATETLGTVEFSSAVRTYLNDFEDKTGIEVHVQELQHICRPDCPEGELELFGILQEALFNASRHGDVESIDVWIRATPDSDSLIVRDHGKGFAVQQAPGPKEGHFGLSLMRERAERLGGMLEIDSEPGQGTTVQFFRNLVEDVVA